MNIISVKKPSKRTGRIKLYATVEADNPQAAPYNVVFIRTKGMKRWMCQCPDMLFRRIAKRQVCKHVHAIQNWMKLYRSVVGTN